MNAPRPFAPGFRLGVLGGGQLGRMLLQAAIDFNLEVAVMDPDPQAPCASLTPLFRHGSITDAQSVVEFGRQCHVLTIEIENVSAEGLRALEGMGVQVRPPARVVELIQDKRAQKQFYRDNGIPTAPFVLTRDRAEVEALAHWLPAVHKLGREGYDGRGVQIIRTPEQLHKAFDKPGLLEKLIDFKKEISVIVARNASGQTQAFPAVELVYHPEHNLVDYLVSPAAIEPAEESAAHALALEIAQKIQLVGILAVEMFLLHDGSLMVNEMAPRTHNSGHQSIEAKFSSQFEQHLRAVLDLPLASTREKIPSAMVNLLGQDGHSGPARYLGMEEVLSIEGASVHLYGKANTKPFRKMGHVTVVDHDRGRLVEKIHQVKRCLRVVSQAQN